MIRVHGHLGPPPEALRALAESATLVVGGRRALDALQVPEERRVVLGLIGPAVERLAALPPGADALVLASGDPLFFGVVRRMRQAGLSCTVTPAVGSLAAAFAAVALPWDDATLASAHGHAEGLGVALAACRALPKVGILTAPGRGAREIARALNGVPRWYVVAERLGEPGERIRILDGPTTAALDDVAEPHVVLVLAHHPDEPEALGRPGAFARSVPELGDSSDEGDASAQPRDPGGPRAEVAVAFSRFLPSLGHLVWSEGRFGDRFGELARRNGAGNVPVPAAVPGDGARPDVVAADEARPDVVAADAPISPALRALLDGLPGVRVFLGLEVGGAEAPPDLAAHGVPAGARVDRYDAGEAQPGSSAYLIDFVVPAPQEGS